MEQRQDWISASCLSVEVFGSGFRSLVSSRELEISSNLETKCDQVGRQAVCREALWSDW